MTNEIITTLHPNQDPDTNLYPNIKKENIPNKSIDMSKIDDELKSLLDSANELHPSGVDTSTNILAFTTNKGIYVGSDTGHWYYWNGVRYVNGGVYQATEIPDGSVTKDKLSPDLNKVIDYTKLQLDFNLLDGTNNILISNKVEIKDDCIEIIPVGTGYSWAVNCYDNEGTNKKTYGFSDNPYEIKNEYSFYEFFIRNDNETITIDDVDKYNFISVNKILISLNDKVTWTPTNLNLMISNKIKINKQFLKVSNITEGYYYAINCYDNDMINQETIGFQGTEILIENKYAYYELFIRRENNTPVENSNVIQFSETDTPTNTFLHFTIRLNTALPTDGDSATETLDSQSFQDIQCVFKLPKTYSKYGKPTDVVMICHGSGLHANFTSWLGGHSEIQDGLVSQGFCVFDVDGFANGEYGNESWGCPRHLEAYYQAYLHLIKNYNLNPTINVYGLSMGGLNALNFCWQHPQIVNSIGLGSPITDLYNQGWLDSWRKERIKTAYGITGDTDADFYAKTKGCDPTAKIVEIDNVNYLFGYNKPMKIWLGTSDEAIPVAGVQLLVNAINNAGGRCTLRLVNGGTHGVCFGDYGNVVNEICMWFNRASDYCGR